MRRSTNSSALYIHIIKKKEKKRQDKPVPVSQTFLSDTILLVHLDSEALGRCSGVGASHSPEFGLTLGPPVLDLDVPSRGTLGSDDGADLLVPARHVLFSRSGDAGAGGVEARGVLGGDAGNVEVVVRSFGARALRDSEVRDVPGQRLTGTALGQSLEGSCQSERGEEGEREELHVVWFFCCVLYEYVNIIYSEEI